AAGDLLLAEPHATGLGTQQAEQGPGEGGLACAVVPEQQHDAAGRHLQVDAVDDALLAVARREPADLQGHAHLKYRSESSGSRISSSGVPSASLRPSSRNTT